MGRRKKIQNVKVQDASGLFADRETNTHTIVMDAKNNRWLTDDLPMDLATVAVSEAIGSELISFGIKPQKVKKFGEYNKIPSLFFY